MTDQLDLDLIDLDWWYELRLLKPITDKIEEYRNMSQLTKPTKITEK